jgi:thiosulfate reductase cytochrome b subunit
MKGSNQNGSISYVQLHKVFIWLLSGHCIVYVQIKETASRCQLATGNRIINVVDKR